MIMIALAATAPPFEMLACVGPRVPKRGGTPYFGRSSSGVRPAGCAPSRQMAVRFQENITSDPVIDAQTH